MAQAQTGIQLRAKIFPLALFFFLFPVVMEVDGQPRQAKWGQTFMPVYPGQHTLVLYYKYWFFLKMNSVTSQVTLIEGQVLNMTYFMRWLVFLPGKLEITPPAAPARAAA